MLSKSFIIFGIASVFYMPLTRNDIFWGVCYYHNLKYVWSNNNLICWDFLKYWLKRLSLQWIVYWAMHTIFLYTTVFSHIGVVKKIILLDGVKSIKLIKQYIYIPENCSQNFELNVFLSSILWDLLSHPCLIYLFVSPLSCSMCILIHTIYTCFLSVQCSVARL